jgi:hypothetical protein
MSLTRRRYGNPDNDPLLVIVNTEQEYREEKK